MVTVVPCLNTDTVMRKKQQLNDAKYYNARNMVYLVQLIQPGVYRVVTRQSVIQGGRVIKRILAGKVQGKDYNIRICQIAEKNLICWLNWQQSVAKPIISRPVKNENLSPELGRFTNTNRTCRDK
ncbi:hypothetical protein CBL_06235 [Carabus blaptoides fortunei]